MTNTRLSKPSQLPLSDNDGKSIIPPEGARCPNCKKVGGCQVKARGSNRTPEGRTRERECTLCKYEWRTEMPLPLRCPCCNAFDDYSVTKTTNDWRGVLRNYRCNSCGANVPAYEAFPVPADKVKYVNDPSIVYG